MKHGMLWAEFMAGLLVIPMYKCSYGHSFVCALVKLKERPPSGLPVWLLSSLFLGVAQVAHLEAAIHSESGCLYMGYLVLLSCWRWPSRKEPCNSACDLLCWWPPTRGCPVSSIGIHLLMDLWRLSLGWALEVVTRAVHWNIVWYPVKILCVQCVLSE